MKKVFKIIAAVVIVLSMLSYAPANSIVGQWKIFYPEGRTVNLSFEKDSTYTVSFDNGEKMEMALAKYYVNKDTFAVWGAGCSTTYWAKYKITFHGSDSLDLKVIEDSCDGRKAGIDGTTGKRISKN